MTQAEMIKILETGNGVAIMRAEYRGCIEDAITWSAGGQSKKSQVRKHALECGSRQMQVTEWPPKGSVVFADQLALPAKRGEQVVVFLSRLEDKGGVLSATGTIQPYRV